MALTTEAEIRLAIPNGDTLAGPVVTSLLAAADAAAKSYMRRTIELATFAERLKWTRGEDVFVSEYPVVSVLSVGVAGSEAFDVWNATATRATVSVTENSLLLRAFAAGAWTPSELLFTTFPTLTQLVAAILALGGGWDAALSSEVTGAEPSHEIGELTGPISVADSQEKTIYLLDEVPDHEIDTEVGSIAFSEVGHASGETVLVRYTAGYATVPADVQRGVAILARELYEHSQSSAEAGLKSEKLGDYEWEQFENQAAVISPTVAKLLGPYRRFIV